MPDFIAQEEKLFGAFISSATINAGYNSQSSTAQLTLVFPDDGPLNPDDFEQNFPPLGTCVGFRLGELKFIGLLQRYVQKKNISGYVWDVVLESPTKVLDGVQVILDTYVGNSFPGLSLIGNQIRNVWNPFGFRESPNSIGSSGSFGLSNVNSMGFPAPDLINLLEYFGNNDSFFGNKILYGITEYTLLLTDLKILIQTYPYVRVKGPSQSLLAVIEEICSLCFADFYVDIAAPDNFVNGVILNPTIIIRAIDRSVPPDVNVIKNAVKRYEQAQLLISADVGKELSDSSTQKMVIGGPASRYVQATNIAQIWGKTKGVRPQYTNYIVLDNGALYEPNILEVRCAIHSFESWLVYQQIIKYLRDKTGNAIYRNYVNTNFELQLFSDLQINDFVIDKIEDGTITPHDFIDTNLSSQFQKNKDDSGEFVREGIERIYNAVKSAGDEFYGKKYMVALPMESGGVDNNIKFVNEDAQYITSWEVADSAWNQKFPYSDVSFYDSDGKMKCSAQWVYAPAVHDYSELGGNYCVDGNVIGAVSNAERDIYFDNFANACGCAVEVPGVKIYDAYTTDHNGLYWLLNLMLGINRTKLEAIHGIGEEIATKTIGIAPDMVTPGIIGVPQVSTRYNWGPWLGALSFNGKAEVLFEQNLTPESFGSIDLMNFAGAQYATVVNSDVGGVESGYIEVAGYPENSVGERFLNSGPYVSTIDVQLDTGGYKTTYKFNTWTPEFGKASKSNLDRISNIYKSSMRARQEFRGKFEKPSFKPQRYRDKNDFANKAAFVAGMNVLAAAINGKKLAMGGGHGAKQIAPVGKDPKKTHMASMEQQNSPVQLNKTKVASPTGPAFAKPKPGNGTNPKFANGHPVPTSEDLDPVFKHKEHDFKVASHSDNPTDLNLQNQKTKPTEVRTVGLRGPLMLSGWGYGIDGRAIPHKTNDITKFDDDVAQDRNKWPTGPIDLKWDEQRKVWCGGMEVLEGVLKTAITPASGPFSPTEFEVIVCRCTDKFVGTTNDDKIKMTWTKTDEVVKCVNRDRTLDVSAGDKYIMIGKINYEWRVLYVECD